MSKEQDGGPAFPKPPSSFTATVQNGMSLRDWFAGQALVGDIALQERGNAQYEQTPENAALMARRAYKFADAMLEARKK